MRHWFVLAVAAVSLHAQVVVTQPGGALHSISVNASKRVFGATARAGIEVPEGSAISELFAAPDGVTLTASAAGDDFVAYAGTVSTPAGDTDLWIGRVALADGQLASVKVGGRGNDIATRITVDKAGAIYVAGNTDSPDFPVTQGRWRGGQDGVLLKLNPDLTTAYAIYLGGASKDDLQDLAVDASGSVFVAAASNSAELAPGAHGSPAFVAADGFAFASTGGGAFRAAVQAWHAPNANVIFAGTAGQGLFRSVDQGQNWDALNQGLNDLNITSIAGDAQTLYAGTPRALYRSTNGGTSWSETVVSASGSGVSALAVSPRDRNIVYAGLRIGCGLFRSADGGRTWQTQRAADMLCVSAILATSDSAYAFTANGVYQMADPQWRPVSALGGVTGVTADDANSAWYAVVAGKGVSKSTDSGATWTDVFSGLATSVALNQGRLYIGTTDHGVINGDLVRVDDAAIQQPVGSVVASGTAVFAGTGYLDDIYVAKVSPRGDQILFSTFVGGLGVESSPRIAIDNGNNTLVAMASTSSDIVATLEAVQRRNAGGADLVIAKLSPSFDLLSLTYLGGAGDETAGGVTTDSRGFVYVTGSSASPNFPLTPNATRKTNDATDAFLAVLSPALGSLTYSTYFGRDGDIDRGLAIALDGANAWIAGAYGATDGFAARFSDLVSYGAIQSVRNSASLAAGPIAPFSAVMITGSGFGATISGLSVRIGDSEASVLRGSDTRIEVVAPGDLNPGSIAPVVVTSRAGLFQGSVAIDRVAPGLFSANQDGQGVALAFVLRIDSDNNTTITPVYECSDGPGTCTASPIEAGDESDQLFLLLRGTGIRNRRSLDDVQVTVGGAPAEVVSADAVDTFSGSDQIVVKMPAGLSDAGKIKDLQITVTVEGKQANTVTMSLIG